MKLKTANRRKQRKNPVGRCECGGSMRLRYHYGEVAFIDGAMKVETRYRSCDQCQIAYMDWRDTDHRDIQLERKSGWKKSDDGLRWIAK